MLLAKPEVLFKSWPEMQHHCWEKGKMDLSALPFLATYDPCVWLVCLGTLQRLPVGHSGFCVSHVPEDLEPASLIQLQLSSLCGMLKSSAEMLALAATRPLKNLPREPASHGSFHCLAVPDRRLLNLLCCFLTVKAKFCKHSFWSTNECVWL